MIELAVDICEEYVFLHQSPVVDLVLAGVRAGGSGRRLLLRPMHGRPHEGGDEGELLRHRSEEAELLQVPQLEGGRGEGQYEVLFSVGDADHGYLTFLTPVPAQNPGVILYYDRGN